MIFKLSFNCIYIIQFVLNCKIIYTVLITEHNNGDDSSVRGIHVFIVDRSGFLIVNTNTWRNLIKIK